MATPKATRDRVLAEFNHKCAVCGTERPRLHHVDGNPATKGAENLLPLCPNCRPVDRHDPTAPIDPLKLRLFRRYRDPVILGPQFHPLLRRLAYLFTVDDDFDFDGALESGVELVAFVNALKMGAFYHVRIADLLTAPNPKLEESALNEPDHVWRERYERRNRRFKAQLQQNRDRAVELVIEMLRYQDWPAQSRAGT